MAAEPPIHQRPPEKDHLRDRPSEKDHLRHRPPEKDHLRHRPSETDVLDVNVSSWLIRHLQKPILLHVNKQLLVLLKH